MKMMTQVGKIWDENKFMFSAYFGMEGIRDFISAHPVEAGITIENYGDCNSYWSSVVKPTVLEKFPQSYIVKAVGAIINERIKWYRNKHELLMIENDEMRNKGIAYTVRKEKVVDKLIVLGRIISECEELARGYRVVPLEQILTPDVVRDIKKRGFKRFLEFNFKQICQKN